MVCVLHFARDGMSFKNGPIFVLRKSPNFGRSPRIDRICQGFRNPSENQGNCGMCLVSASRPPEGTGNFTQGGAP